MKKLLLGIGLGIGVVIALVLAPIGFEPVERTSATSNVASCPDGSYAIGYDTDGITAICKKEPTGCPFGDSIPIEKCTPPPNITCNEDFSKCELKKEKSEGNTNDGSNSEVRDTRSTESQKEYSASCNSGK